MRGLVEGLDSPVPLLLQLPGPYQEDDLAARLVAAFDDALAPVLCTLDNLAAYLDPSLAPDDFVVFLARWVGAEIDEQTELDARRHAVRTAVTTHRRRGTATGLRDVVTHATGGDVEVRESGGASWSISPGANLPGEAAAQVVVRVAVDDPDAVDLTRLEAVVAAATPACVVHVLEVVAR